MKTKLNYHEATTQKNGYVKIHVDDLNSIALYMVYAKERLEDKELKAMAENANELFWKLSDIVDELQNSNNCA